MVNVLCVGNVHQQQCNSADLLVLLLESLMSLCYMHTIHNQQSDQHEVNIFTKLVCILKSKYEKNQMTSHTRNFMPFKVEGDKVDHELNLNPQLLQSS